jgi:hypothetical protein
MVLRFAVDPKFKKFKNKRKVGRIQPSEDASRYWIFYGGMPDNKTKFPEENFP